MRYAVFALLIGFAALAEETPRGKTEVVRYEATVIAAEYFPKYIGVLEVLHRDPRFIVRLQKEGEKPKNFGIHSIAQFFGDEDVKTVVGKRFKFVETRIYRADGTLLRLELVVDRGEKAEK